MKSLKDYIIESSEDKRIIYICADGVYDTYDDFYEEITTALKQNFKLEEGKDYEIFDDTSYSSPEDFDEDEPFTTAMYFYLYGHPEITAEAIDKTFTDEVFVEELDDVD